MKDCIAYATINGNDLAADAGILIPGDTGDVVSDPQDWAVWESERADALLAELGFERDSSWVESGGQMATRVSRS